MDMESDVLDRIVSAVDDRSARGIAAAMSRSVSSGEFPACDGALELVNASWRIRPSPRGASPPRYHRR